MKERVQKAEERKARSKKKFPTIEELRMKASNTKVDNDKTWKHIDEATAEKHEDIDTLRRAGTWRTMPAKDLKEQMEKVFPNCNIPGLHSLESLHCGDHRCRCLMLYKKSV